MSRRRIDKRLNELRQRVHVYRQGVVPIIDTMQWSVEDQEAYLIGSGAEQDALIERLHGPLPIPFDDRAVVAIIITGPPGPPPEREE